MLSVFLISFLSHQHFSAKTIKPLNWLILCLRRPSIFKKNCQLESLLVYTDTSKAVEKNV